MKLLSFSRGWFRLIISCLLYTVHNNTTSGRPQSSLRYGYPFLLFYLSHHYSSWNCRVVQTSVNQYRAATCFCAHSPLFHLFKIAQRNIYLYFYFVGLIIQTEIRIFWNFPSCLLEGMKKNRVEWNHPAVGNHLRTLVAKFKFDQMPHLDCKNIQFRFSFTQLIPSYTVRFNLTFSPRASLVKCTTNYKPSL